MKKKLLIFIFCGFCLLAFKLQESIFFTEPLNWPKANYDFSKNPLSAQKIELGRALFYEPLLSRNNTISCSSCHSQYTAFTHVDHDLSHGIDDRIGSRNSPALMNLAWHKLFMWDGAINHLDVQALAPINHPDEMDEKIEQVISKLQKSKIYPSLFKNAFGDSIITGEHTLKAISQYMLTLVSANSKYDSVMRKQNTFTAQEKNGYNLFKKNCSSCHKEPLFTNLEFENNGLALDKSLNDFGRMKVTKKKSDSLKFKVPTLRNVEFSYPYMHDGRYKKLSDVLKHYTEKIQTSPTLAKQLQKPIILSSNEKVDLIAFLLTLTDKEFIFNPKFSYPKNIFSPKPQE
ncbi:MAG: cytochrome c peroxidase [Bacteroidota bacterium]|nr:cytochrome c peroxidase [Bacteroidota bacterium]